MLENVCSLEEEQTVQRKKIPAMFIDVKLKISGKRAKIGILDFYENDKQIEEHQNIENICSYDIGQCENFGNIIKENRNI